MILANTHYLGSEVLRRQIEVIRGSTLNNAKGKLQSFEKQNVVTVNF